MSDNDFKSWIKARQDDHVDDDQTWEGKDQGRAPPEVAKGFSASVGYGAGRAIVPNSFKAFVTRQKTGEKEPTTPVSTDPESGPQPTRAVTPLDTKTFGKLDKVTPTTETSPTWGPVQETANKGLFGAGPSISAGAATFADKLFGYKSDYAKNQGLYNLARQGYLNEHPTEGAIAGGIGSAIPAGLATAATGGAVGAFGEGMSAAYPAIAPALTTLGDVFGGTAGTVGSATKFAGEGILPKVGNTALALGSNFVNGAWQGAESGLLEGHKDITSDAGLGGLAGTVLGTAGKYLTNPLRAMIHPEVKELTQNLQNQGVRVFPGQIAQDPAMNALHKALVPAEAKAAQLDDLTQAVARTSGADQVMSARGTKGLTPDVIEETKNHVGKILDDAALHTGVPFNQMVQGPNGSLSVFHALMDVRDEAQKSARALNPGAASVISTIDALFREAYANGGTIDGQMYQAFTKGSGGVGQLFKNSATSKFAGDIKSILDMGLEAAAPAEWKGVIGGARSQWKNALIAEKAMENSTTGVVDPVRYASAATRTNNRYGVDANVEALAQAKNLNFSRPSGTGGVTDKESKGLMAKVMGHSASAAGAGALGAGAAIEGIHAVSPLLHVMMGSPLTSGIGAGGALIGAGATLAMRAQRKALMSNPENTKLLLQGGPGWKASKVIPLLEQMQGRQQ